MFIDQQYSPSIPGEVTAQPEYPLAALPRDPERVKETVILIGRPLPKSVTIGGTFDQKESR